MKCSPESRDILSTNTNWSPILRSQLIGCGRFSLREGGVNESRLFQDRQGLGHSESDKSPSVMTYVGLTCRHRTSWKAAVSANSGPLGHALRLF